MLSLTLATLKVTPVQAASVATWGYNGVGSLGNGNTTNSSTPETLTGPLSSGVTAVAAGGGHNLAIQNGGVYAWGYNPYGQLGNGNTTNSSTPVTLTGSLSSGVTAIAGGTYHSLAIKSGGVYAWGYNPYGQLGNGNTTNSSTPVTLTGSLSSGVTAIAGGAYHSLAIQNGGVYAWGYNISGQLGNGNTTNSSTPVALTGALSSGVTSIAGGQLHSLAIKSGGVYAWGHNGFGQLGNGNTTDSSTPVTLTGSLSSGVTAIAGGAYHSLAIKSGGVYAWGYNFSGQLGNGNTTNSTTPIQIDPTDLNSIVAVAAGLSSSYALSSDGSLWVWGYNGNGELGLGTGTLQYRTPQHLLAPTGFKFTSIDADVLGAGAIATLAAVPEPASLAVLSLLGLGLRRKRK